MVSSSMPTQTATHSTNELAECGFKIEDVMQPDGTMTTIQVPLTAEEFLHPQEGYHLPNSTFHDNTAGDAKDMLTRHYANQPNVGIFRDLLIKWDITDLKDHCPDTFVAFNLQNKEQNRTEFHVLEEGTRPALIIEVVSPRYRKQDRETKVVEYAKALVQEYVIIDRRRYRQQVIDEVLGYRLVSGHYQPITPDDEGRIRCDTVGLWMSLPDGHLIMEDVQTGQRLKTSAELAVENQELAIENQELAVENQELAIENQELAVENQELAIENQELAAAKELAQQQVVDMAALLAHYQEQFGNLPEANTQE